MLEVRQSRALDAKLPVGKRATVGDPGLSPTVEPVKALSPAGQASAGPRATHITGRVNGVQTTMLIDTRAAVTIIHSRVWESGRTGTLRKAVGTLVLANGEPLELRGAAKVVIQIGNTSFQQEVMMSDKMAQECLLGADFLVSNGFIIDFQAGVLRRRATCIALHHTEPCRVAMANTTVVRAGEEKLVEGRLAHPKSSEVCYDGVLEPNDSLEARHQVLVARVVAIADSQQLVPVAPFTRTNPDYINPDCNPG